MAERKEVISFTFDPKVCAALRAYAKEQGQSMSAIVESVLRDLLKTK